MPEIQTYLITGASRGLGLATAKILAGHADALVFAGCRNPKAFPLDSLDAQSSKRLVPVQLDVASDDSIAKAVEEVKKELETRGLPPHLSGLVNNAGLSLENGDIIHGRPEVYPRDAKAFRQLLREMYEVNVFGLATMTIAFLPFLEEASSPVVVNVSSNMGSLALHNDPHNFLYGFKQPAYSTTKSAVNQLTVLQSQMYTKVRFVSIHPGYLSTDMTAHNAHTTPVEPGAQHLVDEVRNVNGASGIYLGVGEHLTKPAEGTVGKLVPYPW